PPATSVFYTLSLHDALPISFQDLVFCFTAASTAARKAVGFSEVGGTDSSLMKMVGVFRTPRASPRFRSSSTLAFTCSPLTSFLRSEEHTSELQSLAYLVCRL